MNMKFPEEDKNKFSSTSPLLSPPCVARMSVKERKVVSGNKNVFQFSCTMFVFINLNCYCLNLESAYIYVLICINI